MDRRKSLKLLALSSVSGSMLLDACKNAPVKPKEQMNGKSSGLLYDRMEEEKKEYEKLNAEKFFTPQEMATISILADIIIPADEISGSATQAGVPDFIEFMVKDKPELQTPMRGGLRWLDVQMMKLYGSSFKDGKADQQLALVDAIAYPEKGKPEMQQGIAFFNQMRDLTATGFFTSEIGIKDLGYQGNTPTQWNGVPDDILRKYGLAYTEKELRECVKFG
jgi:gluconate 2-dehydrogenase gamma chain